MMAEKHGLRAMLGVLGAFLVCLTLCLPLLGCRERDERLIRASVGEALDVFKSPTEEDVDALLRDMGLNVDDLAGYGIDVRKMLLCCFARFDYTIDAVDVEGDAAQVRLTLTNADVAAAVAAQTQALKDNHGDYVGLLLSDEGEAAWRRQFFEELFERLESSDATVTTEATLGLHKVDGSWRADETDVRELVAGLLPDPV